MVSIIPGIDARAPERTETSSGRSRSPKRAPTWPPILSSAARICDFSASGSGPPASLLQTSVVMVNPGGTGIPSRVISAKPAPLPPSSSFWLASPSAWPPPKK